MLRSAKNETTGRTRTTDAVCFVGRLVPSRLRTPQGAKGLMLGACAEPLGHEREVVGYRDDHYILHEHILQHR